MAVVAVIRASKWTDQLLVGNAPGKRKFGSVLGVAIRLFEVADVGGKFEELETFLDILSASFGPQVLRKLAVQRSKESF